MKRTYRTFAALVLGGGLGLTFGFAASLGIAPAVVRDMAPVVSNKIAKQDHLDAASPTRRTPQAVAVSHVEAAGPAGSVVMLLDRDGRVVYRHDPAATVTVVARGAVIPMGLDARSAPQDAGRRETVRIAKADREDLTAGTRSERR